MQLDYYQLELVQQYIDLLDTVEQGFQYVLESFHNLDRTDGDQVLSDIFNALISMGESNKGLISESLQNQYEEVIKKALELDGKLNQPEQKKAIVEESLYPAFIDWKKEVQAFLMPLVGN